MELRNELLVEDVECTEPKEISLIRASNIEILSHFHIHPYNACWFSNLVRKFIKI